VLGTTPFKARRTRIVRRISSHRSGSSFDQPSPGPSNVQPTGRHQRRPSPREPEGVVEEEDSEDEENGEGDPADESEDEAAVLSRLRKRPKDRWYKSLGKLFAIRIWPWTTTNWWIGDLGGEAIMGPGYASKKQDPERAKSAKEKKKLDMAAMQRFNVFLNIDMGIPEGEWMSQEFMSQVTFCTQPRPDGF